MALCGSYHNCMKNSIPIKMNYPKKYDRIFFSKNEESMG